MLTELPRSERMVALPLHTERFTLPAPSEPSASITRTLGRHRLGEASAIDALFDALPVGVLVADVDGEILYANAPARRWRAGQLDEIGDVVARAVRTGGVARLDPIAPSRADGRSQWLTLVAQPLRGPDGRTRGATVFVTDVSDRMRLAEWEPIMESLARL